MQRTLWTQRAGRKLLLGIAYDCCGHHWESLVENPGDHTPPRCPTCRSICIDGVPGSKSPASPSSTAKAPAAKSSPEAVSTPPSLSLKTDTAPSSAVTPSVNIDRNPLLARACRRIDNNLHVHLECGHKITRVEADDRYSHSAYYPKYCKYATFYFCPQCSATPHPVTNPQRNSPSPLDADEKARIRFERRMQTA